MQHFDLCVIGSGSGNSLIDERFDLRSVALVDGGERFGGTCLNAGCIPSKMFSYPADLAESVRHASGIGLSGSASLNWRAVQDRVFGRIDPIAASGEAWRRRQGNVALFREQAHFVAPKVLQVGDDRLSADTFVLAAGSRPWLPEVPGLVEAQAAGRVHTSEDIMRLPELPRRLVIVGGGSVAVEFAHIFAAFGTQVTLLNRGQRLLRKADDAIAERFTEELGSRLTLRLGQTLSWLDVEDGSVGVGTVDADGIEYEFEGDHVLLAMGRIPNSDTLDVAATGVELDSHGYVVVDEHQQTNVPGIYALGDLCYPGQLKHVANHQAKVVGHNVLHPDEPISADLRFVPQAVFAHPQVAWVGATEQELMTSGTPFVSAVREYADVAYGWAMADQGHCVKLLADPTSKLLLGAHIVGPDASVLIQPLIQAMSFRLTVPQMAKGQFWIHPALTEVVENALLDLKL